MDITITAEPRKQAAASTTPPEFHTAASTASGIMRECREHMEMTRALYLEARGRVAELSRESEVLRQFLGHIVPRAGQHVPDPPAEAGPARESSETDRLKLLTTREIEVLRLIAEGLRTKEIAFQLGITFKTAVTHRTNLMEKLQVHQAPNLVRFAIRAGLCKP